MRPLRPQGSSTSLRKSKGRPRERAVAQGAWKRARSMERNELKGRRDSIEGLGNTAGMARLPKWGELVIGVQAER